MLTRLGIALVLAGSLLCIRTADAQITGGIDIDAEGVVRPKFSTSRADQLSRRQQEAFAADHLPGDLQPYSALRKVSLVRLEQAYAACLDDGEAIPEEMQHVAGLQQIHYVFVDPIGKDVVLAGPAEGFAPDGAGRMVGLTTGRPPLNLDDVIVALRTRESIGCSIDPDTGRLAQLKEYVRQNSTPTSSSGAKRRYTQMARILGLEDVSVWGVPEDSHFAHTLVEADYRMKRIALGSEPSGVRGIVSHLSLITPNGNSMQRWWFAPYYEAIYTSGDGNAFQLVGQRAQLLAQEERVDNAGGRSNAAFTRASTQRFAQLFTENFERLTAASPVFAELQNLFDVAVVAALLRKEGVFDKIQWQADVFRDPARAALQTMPVARQVPSEAMTKPARRGTMLGLIGGVTLDPDGVLRGVSMEEGNAALAMVAVRDAALQQTGERVMDGKAQNANRWWWD